MEARRDPSPARGLARWTTLACALAIFCFATWLTTRSTLWDRDEPRFAQAAVEMASSGQWLYPTFNGELRPDKPILIYWLMALPVRWLGASEWAVRAWSPLALAASAWLTLRIARRFVPERAALLAALVLASTPLALVEGTVSTTDAVLLACTTAAMGAFAALSGDGARPRLLAALALALGAAQLVKGPVGLALPLSAMLAALWLARRGGVFERGTWKKLALAAVSSVALFLAWAVPANSATHGEFARRGLGHHVADRVLQPLEGHGGSWVLGLFFYLPVIAVGLGPWLLQLPAAGTALWNGRLGNPAQRALLEGWILAPFCLLSLVSTKLPHYVLPIFPALAIAVAAVIDAAEHGALAARDLRWLARGAWLYGGVLALEVAAAAVAASQPGFELLRGPLLAVALLLLVPGAAAIVLHALRRWRAAALCSLAGSVALWLVVGTYVLPRVEELKLAPPLAAAVRAATDADVPLATYRFDEPSLVFYCGRWPVESLAGDAAVAAWCAEPRDGVLVVPRAELSELERRGAASGLREIASATGVNYSKRARTIELVALRRGGR